jgi:hypothetical protein
MPAPHSCLSFRKAKARAKKRIGPAKTAVMRVLLDNLQNGTRTATVSQEEIARSGSFHPIYVRRLLRGLDRDDPPGPTCKTPRRKYVSPFSRAAA